MTEEITDFDALIGCEFDFYGANLNQFKLNDAVYEAIENEDDGYRSYLGSVERKQPTGIFFDTPIACVRLEHKTDSYSTIYSLRDVSDGHVWLRFGTENEDDCYPWFLFSYEPKQP